MDQDNKDWEIRNRESWLKILTVALFSLIIEWKIFNSSFNLDLSKFDFSDLLSLILALFAIYLSVQFYFKAEEASNKFYDNTYKFTKDVSEILGRIEAGFGEKLRHIDEGYTGLRDKLISRDPIKAERQVKEEEKEVKIKEQERDKLIEDLAKKAELQEGEKKELFQKLREKDSSLISAKNELEFLKRRLGHAEWRSSSNHLTNNMPAGMLSYIRHRVINEIGSDIIGASPNIIIKRFNSIKEDLPERFIIDMKNSGLADSSGNLTEKGAKVLREIALPF